MMQEKLFCNKVTVWPAKLSITKPTKTGRNEGWGQTRMALR